MKHLVRAALAASLGIALAGCTSQPSALNDPAAESAIAQIVRANSVSLRTIEPGGSDFSDLEAFGRAVGDKSIVILGEPTHRDGDIYKLKARLVQYLHEVKGFDVLLVESGMFDLARIRERHLKDGTPYAALSPGRMFFMYSRSEDGRRVLNYVDASQKTSRPLQMAGFDISMGGDSSTRELLPMLGQFLAERGSTIPASADWSGYRAVASQVVGLDAKRPSAEDAAAFQRVSSRLDAELCATQADAFAFTQSPSFWCRVVRSVHAGGERMWGPVDMRDRAGGDNVKWLLDHPFSGKKIVLWMHSFHGTNGQVFPPSGPTWVSVGTRLVQLYGDQVYMTHFTAGKGSIDSFFCTATTLPALGSGMLEHYLAKTEAPQFMSYPNDPAARERIRTLGVFEPDFCPTSPNHFGSGYQGLFFIPTTRAIVPDADRFPLVP